MGTTRFSQIVDEASSNESAHIVLALNCRQASSLAICDAPSSRVSSR